MSLFTEITRFSMFAREDIVNVFCDASTTSPDENGNVTACSGFIAIKCGQIIEEYYHFINDTSSFYAELDALRLSISYAISASKLYKRVNIFSDCQAGVFGIRNWIGRWRLQNGNLFGTKIVQNQQVYVEIATMLIDAGQTNIAIYHQKGHVDLKCSEQILRKARNIFTQSNGVPKESAGLEFIRYISICNTYVDAATRKLLTDIDLDGIDYVEPLEFSTAKFDDIQKRVAPILHKMKQNMYLI